MRTKPTLIINLHCEEGRGMIQMSLDSFSKVERAFMVSLFGKAEQGSAVDFCVGDTPDGRHCMQFTVGLPEKADAPV